MTIDDIMKSPLLSDSSLKQKAYDLISEICSQIKILEKSSKICDGQLFETTGKPSVRFFYNKTSHLVMQYFYKDFPEYSLTHAKIHFKNGDVIVKFTYSDNSDPTSLWDYKTIKIQDLRSCAEIIEVSQEKTDENGEAITSHTLKMSFNRKQVQAEYDKNGVLIPPSSGFNLLEVMKMRTNLLCMEKATTVEC